LDNLLLVYISNFVTMIAPAPSRLHRVGKRLESSFQTCLFRYNRLNFIYEVQPIVVGKQIYLNFVINSIGS